MEGDEKVIKCILCILPQNPLKLPTQNGHFQNQLRYIASQPMVMGLFFIAFKCIRYPVDMKRCLVSISDFWTAYCNIAGHELEKFWIGQQMCTLCTL